MRKLQVIAAVDKNTEPATVFCYNFYEQAFYVHTVITPKNAVCFDALLYNYTPQEYTFALNRAEQAGLTDTGIDMLDLDEEFIIGGEDPEPNILTIVQNLIPHALHLLNAITASNKAATAAQTRTKIAISVLPYIVAAGEDPKDAAARAYEYADAFLNLQNTSHE